MLLKWEVSRVLERSQGAGSRAQLPLALIPGSSDYYQQIERKLEVMAQWLGPPLYLITTSMNTTTDECLATYVSHYIGTKEEPVEVWHKEEELELLTLLPGEVPPGG